MNLKYGVLVLIVSAFVMTGFSMNAFGEEVTFQKPLSMGSNHMGSMLKTQTVSSDGSVWIFLTATEPVKGEHMTINVKFTDKNGKVMNDINYDIRATQNDQVVLSDMMVHQHVGIADHITQVLSSNQSVNVNITLQGFGENAPFTGPQGESIPIKVVPEFGAIATIILGISILSIMIISAKNKVSFKSLNYN